jgi:hypothetical protein
MTVFQSDHPAFISLSSMFGGMFPYDSSSTNIVITEEEGDHLTNVSYWLPLQFDTLPDGFG